MGRPSKIVVQTMGSRGDVQPFIAIASALKAAGYDVCVLTCSNFITLCEDSNLESRAVFFDSQKLMQEDETIKKSMSDGDVFTFLKAVNNIFGVYAEEHVRQWYEEMERFKPDLVVSGTGCQTFGALAERHLRIPKFEVTLQCIPENPRKMVFGLPNLPCGCNKLVIRFILRAEGYKQLSGPYDPVCQKLKGFKVSDVWTADDLWADITAPRFGSLVGVSPVVAKELTTSLPAGLKFCGHFSVPSDAQVESATGAAKSGIFGSADTIEAIKSFIESGSKPVYMGWGSMMAKSPESMAELIANAVRLAGSRAIVFSGWAKLDKGTVRKAIKDPALLEYAEKNLLFVGKTPHDWLFPQCSCIVHHGGSGTMASAARSGAPQIITPVFLDQWDHARFVNNFGAGWSFERTQLSNLSAKDLSEAIKKCETDAQIKSKAALWAEISKSENGPLRVVEHVEWFWTQCVETGAYEQYITERLAVIERERASRCCG